MGKLKSKKFWTNALARALRTFIQSVLAVWTASTLVTQIDWKVMLITAISAAGYSLLTSVLAGLPESKVD